MPLPTVVRPMCLTFSMPGIYGGDGAGGRRSDWRFRRRRSARVARDRRLGNDESRARRHRRRTLYANDSYVPYTAPTAPPTVAPSAAPVITLFAHLLSVNMARLPNPRARASRCVRSRQPVTEKLVARASSDAVSGILT